VRDANPRTDQFALVLDRLKAIAALKQGPSESVSLQVWRCYLAEAALGVFSLMELLHTIEEALVSRIERLALVIGGKALLLLS
jgi:hypothetical protein